jgi:hypothetical protein
MRISLQHNSGRARGATLEASRLLVGFGWQFARSVAVIPRFRDSWTLPGSESSSASVDSLLDVWLGFPASETLLALQGTVPAVRCAGLCVPDRIEASPHCLWRGPRRRGTPLLRATCTAGGPGLFAGYAAARAPTHQPPPASTLAGSDTVTVDAGFGLQAEVEEVSRRQER